MKHQQKFVNPRKNRTFHLFLGVGHSVTPVTFIESIFTSPSETMSLRYSISLLWWEVEFVLMKPFHHLLDYPLVLCQELGEDQDVIHVYTDHSFHDEVLVVVK